MPTIRDTLAIFAAIVAKITGLTKKEKTASGLCCLNSLTKSYIAMISLNGFSPFVFKVWSSGVAPNEIIFFLLSSL